MGRVLIPFLVIGVAALAGCGGAGSSSDGCEGGVSYGLSNPSYEGTYSGSYDPTEGDETSVSFEINISTSGSIVGTAFDPLTERSGSVTGTTFDWFEPCRDDETFIEIRIQNAGDQATRIVFGRRNLGQTQPWIFNGVVQVKGQTIGKGKLSLFRQ